MSAKIACRGAIVDVRNSATSGIQALTVASCSCNVVTAKNSERECSLVQIQHMSSCFDYDLLLLV